MSYNVKQCCVISVTALYVYQRRSLVRSAWYIFAFLEIPQHFEKVYLLNEQ